MSKTKRKEELEEFISGKLISKGKTSEVDSMLKVFHELTVEMDLSGEPFQTVLRRVCKENDTDFDETLKEVLELKKELLN